MQQNWSDCRFFVSSYHVLTPSLCCHAQREPYYHQIKLSARQFKPDAISFSCLRMYILCALSSSPFMNILHGRLVWLSVISGKEKTKFLPAVYHKMRLKFGWYNIRDCVIKCISFCNLVKCEDIPCFGCMDQVIVGSFSIA